MAWTLWQVWACTVALLLVAVNGAQGAGGMLVLPTGHVLVWSVAPAGAPRRWGVEFTWWSCCGHCTARCWVGVFGSDGALLRCAVIGARNAE